MSADLMLSDPMRSDPMLSRPRRRGGWLARRAERWAARRDVRIDAWLIRPARVDLRARWREAVERSGFGEKLFTPLGGFGTGWLPLVTHVEPARHFGESAYLIVRHLGGETNCGPCARRTGAVSP